MSRSPLDHAPDDLDAPFWEGCERGEFLLLRCPESGRWHWPAVADPETGAGLEWVPASGRGRIHTFTIIHKVFRPELAEHVPYNVIVVELEEGPFFHSNLVGVPNDEIRVGMTVEVVFDAPGFPGEEGMRLPRFRPRGAS